MQNIKQGSILKLLIGQYKKFKNVKCTPNHITHVNNGNFYLIQITFKFQRINKYSTDLTKLRWKICNQLTRECKCFTVMRCCKCRHTKSSNLKSLNYSEMLFFVEIEQNITFLLLLLPFYLPWSTMLKRTMIHC